VLSNIQQEWRTVQRLRQNDRVYGRAKSNVPRNDVDACSHLLPRAQISKLVLRGVVRWRGRIMRRLFLSTGIEGVRACFLPFPSHDMLSPDVLARTALSSRLESKRAGESCHTLSQPGSVLLSHLTP
jgi:hypothetical protein